MNTWNELVIKPEHLVQQQQQMNNIYSSNANNTDPTNLNENSNPMFNQAHHLNQPQQQQSAAMAAAMATAMMMSQQPGHGSNNSLNNLNNSMHDLENGDNDDSMDNSDDDCNSSVNDAEGVWSADIEQSFQEALAIYPPCGRRKIILSEEGKMYGRNELIARYIKVRTGKTRSRKQVSSHIQVLAKRKTKDFHNHLKDVKDPKFSTGIYQNPFSNLTSAQIISPQPIIPLQSQQNLVVPSPSTIISNSSKLNGSNNNNNNNISNNNSSNTNTNSNNNNSSTSCSNNSNNPNQNNSVGNTPSGANRPNMNNQTSQAVLNQTQRNQPGAHQVHHPQLLQNCTNILTGPQQNSIWSHPGIQHSDKALVPPSGQQMLDDMLNSNNTNNSQNNENIRNLNHHFHHHHAHHAHHNNHHQSNQQLSPDSSPNNNQLWSLYSNNNNNNNNTNNTNLNGIYSKSVIGLNGLRLIEFSGFLEKRRDPEISINYKEFSDKFPENDLTWSIQTQEKTQLCSSYLIKYWVDLNYILEDGISSLYAVSNIFESPEPMTISCSTKVCSFGNQVVEKVENEQAQYEAGRYVYRFENSPMCEYMITFINKLKQLPEKNLKNSVLENFSVLQIIKNHDTKEVLLTLAYVFEVSTSEHGAQHVIYRLTNK